LKLVKYKVGKKNSVFFFLYRDKNDENSLSGFYFFVIKKKEDLHNLENFVVDLEQTKILMDSLDPAIRSKYLWVSESGIYNRQDLDFVQSCGASAVLVGESLIKQENIEEAVNSLLN
jgi:hypothetical protein